MIQFVLKDHLADVRIDWGILYLVAQNRKGI